MKKLNKFIVVILVILLVGVIVFIFVICNFRKLVRVIKEKWDEYKKKKEEKKKVKEVERNKVDNGVK